MRDKKSLERTPKRQRKPDSTKTGYCKNSACKAKLNCNDVFCKRCSCCICGKYDDNKDPSLWLICSSDSPFHGNSCGSSCHVECALLHENSGLSMDRRDDGSFCCVSCGKVNDLLGSWRKQLAVAMDTRRVDILCYRLSLAQKILAGTERFQNLRGVVDKAVEKLEEEVGTLTGLPVKKARGIVNRLPSGPEIQKLCAFAVESLDSTLSMWISYPPTDCDVLASKLVKFEGIQASSVTVVLSSEDSEMERITGYILWHRKVDDTNYPAEPTCRLFAPNAKFLLTSLNPDTRYFLKVVTLNRDGDTRLGEFQFTTDDEVKHQTMGVERSESPAANCSSLSNPSSMEDEMNNGMIPDKIGSEPSSGAVNFRNKEFLKARMDNGSNTPQTGLECVPYVDSSGPEPCKPTGVKEAQGGSSSKKGKERKDDRCTGNGDKDFEYYVKVIRLLECDGHIEMGFRQRFLTWYSLRAKPREVRIVKAFVDAFVDDPETLAAQIVDTFSDVVSNKRCCRVPSGFCMKLWH